MTVFDALELCPDFYANLQFSVLNVDQVIATARTNEDLSSAGQVFFTRLPEPASGAYAVVANVYEGERTLAVFCDQDFGDGTFQVVPVRVSDNRMDQELGMAAGDTLRCSWFVEWCPVLVGTHPPDSPVQEAASGGADEELPAEEPVSEALPTPGITVLAWLCPPEIVAQSVDLTVVCSLPGAGITFDIAIGGEPSSTQTTDESGEIDIVLGVGPATYLINNRPNPGLSAPQVDCTITHADRTTEQVFGYLPAGSPGQEISFDGTSEVICIFYFLGELEVGDPAQDGAASPEDQAAAGESEVEGNAAAAPHTLTIQFWICPVGTDPATDQVDLLQACGTDPGERSFILTIDGVSTGDTVTGAETWEFNDATVFAEIGAGSTSSAWCNSNWVEGNEDAADVPDTVLLEGGLLTITVSQPATAVSCDWFLFPD